MISEGFSNLNSSILFWRKCSQSWVKVDILNISWVRIFFLRDPINPMASPKPSFIQRYLRFWAVTMLQRNRYHWQHLAVSYIVIRIMTSKLIRGKKTLPNLSWLELLIFIWIFNSIYLKHFIPSFHVSFTNCLLCHVFSIISVLQSFNLDYFYLTSIIFVVELHHMRHSTCMCWVHFGKNNSNWSICRLSIKKNPY